MASNLVARLAGVDCTVVPIIRPGGAAPSGVEGRVRCEHLAGDIAERVFWGQALTGVDYVFHFAAQTSVYSADQNPLADWKANVLPMFALLEACREAGHRPMILFAATAT